ncbi:hypothetical protein [Trinickia diaoshuihuensis]|uniref:hypothetical protein n=1 Tax=Trinickia diaoshuihuensis TaxID=2292265 RepID=UPI000E26D182|nr:hypothetical protein [Trinickia diaoshuihuensis]
MAEFIPPQEGIGRPGHLPNVPATLVELHRLVAIFLASKGFAELLEAGAGHAAEIRAPLWQLQEVEEDEITRILLTLAITARVVDDANHRALDLVAGPCGTLVQDIQNPDGSRSLELREACNKLIHAERRRFDIEQTDGGRPYLTPTLYLYGSQGRFEWKATLDVIAFAKEYTSCVTAL